MTTKRGTNSMDLAIDVAKALAEGILHALLIIGSFWLGWTKRPLSRTLCWIRDFLLGAMDGLRKLTGVKSPTGQSEGRGQATFSAQEGFVVIITPQDDRVMLVPPDTADELALALYKMSSRAREQQEKQ